MKRAMVIFFACVFSAMLYPQNDANIINQLNAYAEKNGLEFVDYCKGDVTAPNKSDVVAFFLTKQTEFTYQAVCFEEQNGVVAKGRLIAEYDNYIHSSIDKAFLKQSPSSCALAFCADVNKNGLDEIYIDSGLDMACPKVIEFDGKEFVSLFDCPAYPVSNVIQPGAPEIYEVWQLIFCSDNSFTLRRYQEDLAQYAKISWNKKSKKFEDADKDKAFENTGFANSGIADFEKLNRKLEQAYLKTLTPKQLRLLRNAIYARCGRKFSAWDLAYNFETCVWYKENPNFSESDLSELDKENIKRIQNEEKIKGEYKPIKWDLHRNGD